jgi:hypothetical protein
LQASTPTVTFSGLPSTYRDLILICNAGTTAAAFANGEMRFNGDTATNYSRVQAIGTNVNTAVSFAAGSENAIKSILFSDDSVLGTNVFQIMDYSATDKHKTALLRSSIMPSGEDRVMMSAGRWANNEAITSVTLFPSGASFSIGSTFSLYGRIA